MSTLYAAGVDDALKQGIGNGSQFQMGIEGSVDETNAGYNNTPTVVGSIPTTIDPSADPGAYSRLGSQIQSVRTPSWESDADNQTIEQFKVRFEDVSGNGVHDFGAWNNGGTGFGESFNNGANATVENFDVECQRAGIAECFIKGTGSAGTDLDAHVYLLDGTGARIGADTTSWAAKDPSEDLQGSSLGLIYSNDISFTNTSGSDSTVGGVEVEWGGSGNLILSQTFSNVTLADGSKITFTTLEVTFSGLA